MVPSMNWHGPIHDWITDITVICVVDQGVVKSPTYYVGDLALQDMVVSMI